MQLCCQRLFILNIYDFEADVHGSISANKQALVKSLLSNNKNRLPYFLQKSILAADYCPLVGVQGFEPRKCLSQSQVPYRLATPQYTAADTMNMDGNCLFDGWDRWIRTIEMTESKSVALPLGYIPIYRI